MYTHTGILCICINVDVWGCGFKGIWRYLGFRVWGLCLVVETATQRRAWLWKPTGSDRVSSPHR